MHLFNYLYQNVFFKGIDAVRGRETIDRLKFLRKSQFWDKSRLESWQLEQLNKLLLSSKSHSLFFAERLGNLELPLKSLEELQLIPVLTKKEIRENLQTIVCNNVRRKHLELCTTGGSTGEPMSFYQDLNCKNWNRGSVYRSAEWANTFLGDKTVQMTGSHFDETEFNKLKWKIIFFLQRYKNLPVVAASDSLFEKYYKEIQKYRPASIWGFSGSIFLFSEFIKKRYPSSNFNFLQAIITSSETLRPEWRESINDVFKGDKVFDHYGSREVYIASECKEHNGYHIHAETILLEIVDKNGLQLPPGEMGRVLVTDLSNLSFPFIRYEIGDVGVLAEPRQCSCGVTLPKLKSIEGRITDIVVLKDRQIITLNFNNLMSDVEGIDQYQVVQQTMDNVVVKIVKNKVFTSVSEERLRSGLTQLLGNDVHVKVEYVENIEVSSSGKRRYVISDIPVN